MTATTTANDSINPRHGGYGWSMADSRKLDERLNGVLSRKMREIAARKGVSVESLLAESPAERAADEAAGMHEWREQKARALLARIPLVYRDAETRVPKTETWIERYLAGDVVSYLLLGEVGQGKTWEAYAILRRLLVEHLVPVGFVTAPDLVAMLRPNADGQADVGLLQSAPVLVLDDLGTERMTEWAAEQLWRVANFRAERRMPWIVTSNLSRTEIEDRYDERLVRRLFGDDAMIAKVSHRPRVRLDERD
jgi:DNA replication protein DnaC